MVEKVDRSALGSGAVATLSEALIASQSYDELGARFLDLAHHFGFERYAVSLMRQYPGKTQTIGSLTNAPDEFIGEFTSATAAQRDPVFVHLTETNLPIVYDQDLYVRARAGDLWESQERHGYSLGVAVSVPIPRMGKLLVGLDRGGRQSIGGELAMRLVADLQLLAVLASGVLVSHLGPPVPQITDQQAKVLQLIAAGKSAGVIAQIIGISQTTVNHHTRKLCDRLGVATREQVVAEAFRSGLLF